MDMDETYALRGAYIFICCDKCCNFVHRIARLVVCLRSLINEAQVFL